MDETRTKKRERWIALVLALLCAGLGHVYVGRLWLGLAIYFVPMLLWCAVITIATIVEAPLLTTFIVLIPLVLGVHIAQMLWAGAIAKRLPVDFALRWFNRKLVYVAFLVVVVVVPTTELVKWFVVESFRLPSGSMAPTVLVGDHFFARKLGYQPKRGDIVVFRYPNDETKSFVKRIVALGGDTVAIKDDVLLLNGSPIKRRKVPGPCVFHEPEETGGGWTKRGCVAFEEELGGTRYRVIHDAPRTAFGLDVKERKVLRGQMFVVGDNRDNSFDSRAFGPVEVSKIRAKVDSIWWSSGPGGLRMERLGKKLR